MSPQNKHEVLARFVSLATLGLAVEGCAELGLNSDGSATPAPTPTLTPTDGPVMKYGVQFSTSLDISGKVIDKTTRAAVAKARVSCGMQSVESGNDGTFTIKVGSSSIAPDQDTTEVSATTDSGLSAWKTVSDSDPAPTRFVARDVILEVEPSTVTPEYAAPVPAYGVEVPSSLREP